MTKDQASSYTKGSLLGFLEAEKEALLEQYFASNCSEEKKRIKAQIDDILDLIEIKKM